MCLCVPPFPPSPSSIPPSCLLPRRRLCNSVSPSYRTKPSCLPRRATCCVADECNAGPNHLDRSKCHVASWNDTVRRLPRITCNNVRSGKRTFDFERCIHKVVDVFRAPLDYFRAKLVRYRVIEQRDFLIFSKPTKTLVEISYAVSPCSFGRLAQLLSTAAEE